MKIVVLDSYALNPGDLSWKKLEALGEVTLYERSKAEEVVARARGAEIILTNKVPINAEAIAALPQLQYIGVMATGYNIIDLQAAKARNITVTNVPGYSTASVVQLTFTLLLELCYRSQRHSDAVHEGRWANSKDFSFWDYPLTELAGKTLGIIGLGSIGQGVADVAAAFGMQVLAYSRTLTDQSQRRNFAWAVSPDEVFAQADVISLHCPQTPQTENIINRDSLKHFKPSAILINTSRGGLIDAQALAEALNEERIAGAGIDVLAVEPPPAEHPLMCVKNCIITPHIGWATQEARSRMMELMSNNVQAFLNGKAINVL